MKGQNWNGPGLLMAFKTLFKPSLLRPSEVVGSLNQIDFQSLKAQGYLGIGLDKDNTLTAPYSLDIHPSIRVL
jgi:phosphatidylglycerophosphatase GEP4